MNSLIDIPNETVEKGTGLKPVEIWSSKYASLAVVVKG
jgi:hypothetical protein